MGRRGKSPAGEGEGGREPGISRTPEGAVVMRGLLRSEDGLVLARLTVRGETYAAASAAAERRRATWAALLLTLCVVVIARRVYDGWGRRRREGESGPRRLLRRIALLAFFLGLVRFLLLRIDMPGEIFGIDLFDAALFGDDAPGGLMRTAGDYLISSAFLLALVFGVVKAFRTYYGGTLEKPVSRGGSFSIPRMLARAVLMTGVLAGAAFGSTMLVSRTVLNSNPRLIGLDVAFFSIRPNLPFTIS